MIDGLIAVTGAGGFIGSHVVRALDRAGIAVRALLGPADTVVDAPAAGAAAAGSAARADARGMQSSRAVKARRA